MAKFEHMLSPKGAGPDKTSYSPLYTAEGNVPVNSLAFFFFFLS